MGEEMNKREKSIYIPWYTNQLIDFLTRMQIFNYSIHKISHVLNSLIQISFFPSVNKILSKTY